MNDVNETTRHRVALPPLCLILAVFAVSVALLACGTTGPLDASWQRLDEALSYADDIDLLAEGEQLEAYRDAVLRGRRMRELQDVTNGQVVDMAREIEEARAAAEEVEVVYGWNKPMPSYRDLIDNAERYRYRKFLFRRIVSRVDDVKEWGLDMDGVYIHMALTPGEYNDEPIVLSVGLTVEEPGAPCRFIGSYSYPAWYPDGEQFPCFSLVERLSEEEYEEWAGTATVPIDDRLERSRLSMLLDRYAEDEGIYLRDEGWDRYSSAVDRCRRLLDDADASEEDFSNAADDLEELRAQLKTNVYGEGIPLPSFSDVSGNPEGYRGRLFLISGRITNVHDTVPGIKKTRDNPTGGDYDPIEAYVKWDEDGRVGEVAHVKIRRVNYKTRMRDRGHFSAICTLEGVDERGLPVLTCESYTYHR